MSVKILTPKQLTARIASIAKRGKTLQEDIHQACVSSAVHLLEHGDIRPINQLCEVTSTLTHMNAVRRWFNANCRGMIAWDKKAESFIIEKEKRNAIRTDDKKASEFLAYIVEAKPYYETKEGQKDPEAFDFMKKLGALIAQAKRRQNGETKVTTDDDNFDGLDLFARYFEANKMNSVSAQITAASNIGSATEH